MPRVIITSYGSTGDLNPFLAIGAALRDRGHAVTFAVEDSFAPAVTALDFPTHRLSGDMEADLLPYQRAMFGGGSPFASVGAIVNHYIAPHLRARIEELRAACEGADLLLSSASQMAARAVAELTGIPWISVALSPTFASRYLVPQPQAFELPALLQHTANRIGWSLGNAALRRIVDRPINAARAELGLPPGRDLLSYGSLSRAYTAVAVSPGFAPRPPDWPTYVRVTGFCFWDTPSAWREPPELAALLDGARPVVAVSAGSMAPSVRRQFVDFFTASVAAIWSIGARALVIGAEPESLPEIARESETLVLPFAPFSSVYPRCAAVIHHGGIGTLAQALRAGVPSLVVPWGADQFFTAGQVARIGAGRWLRRRGYTAERARRALDALLNDTGYRQRTRAIAEQIASEDGPGVICAAVERVLQSGR